VRPRGAVIRMEKRRSLKLAIPPQGTERPTCCNGTPDQVASWAAKLPVAKPLATAKALHDALAELNRFGMDFAARFEGLEHLRSFVHASCTAIARRRRDRPLLLDERARKEAALAQRTQYQLAIGYKIVLVTALRTGVVLEPDGADGTPSWTLVVAIHRSLTELLHTLHRSLQFYTRPPAGLWEQLHSLYALAEMRRVHDEPVRDDQQSLRQLTVPSDVYERAVLLATSQPNQLRQQDLGTLFTALEAWTSLVQVVPLSALDAPVVQMDLGSDAPPRAMTRGGTEAGESLRTVDTRRLVQKFGEYLDGDPARAHPELAMVDLEHRELVRHCARVWGEATDRAYERTPASGTVEACTGLEHVHFHAGGERSLLRQMQSERFDGDLTDELEDDDYVDPFAGAADLDGPRTLKLDATPKPRRFVEGEEEDASAHPLSSLALSDVSPIGFGLFCAGEAPEGIETGQLLGLREADDPDWRITLVRWVANARGEARFGVETLAQRALSGGARLVSARERDIAFAPALLLPGIEALDLPTRLITPPGSFPLGQKLAFAQGGRETKLLLESSLAVTEGFELLQVRELVSAVAAEQDTGIELEVMSEEEERAALAAFGLLEDGEQTSP